MRVSRAKGGERISNSVFVDGSVHFLPSSIDPRVLEAMATVAGGEDLSQFGWEGF